MNKNKQPAGSIQVSCHHCHWNGKFKDLVVVYVPNPVLSGDVTPEIACPACFQPDQLEFRDSPWQRICQQLHPIKPTLEEGVRLLTNKHVHECSTARHALYRNLRVAEERMEALWQTVHQ
jgi:hypothetical protein